MTDFFLIETEPRKAESVSRAIQAFGFETWLPMETRFHRNRTKRSLSRMWSVPILIDAFFAAVPRDRHGELQRIKGFAGIYRDCDYIAASVPWDQVRAFMDEVNTINARTERLFKTMINGKQHTKRRFEPMTPEALRAYMAEKFGIVREDAA